MDKLKNLLKSDTPTGEPTSTSGSGTAGLTGQGSHFPSKEETPATQGATDGAQSYTIGGDFPKTESSADGSGTAAIGQTSTYSSSHLTSGDPTPSVIDPTSSDPLTYKKPESGSQLPESGVAAGAAATAASLAFTQSEERKKEIPGTENPYRAAHLDPRVDGLSAATAAQSEASAPAPQPTAGYSTSTGAASGASAGAASAAASTAYTDSKARESAAAPSSLTTTADPADRSTEYGSTTVDKGLSSSATEASAAPPTEPAENRQSMVGKVLGAVGLGGILGGTAASAHDSSAVADTPDQPTTTTGLSSYTAPTQQGTPTSHHRKESIPTTAYPSGTFDSVRAINPPLGGAGSPVTHAEHEGHSTSNVAAGTAAGTAAVGAAAVGAHEYEKSKDLREGVSGESHGSAPVLKESGDTRALTGVDASRYDDSQKLRENISGNPSTDNNSGGGISSIHHATTIDEGSATTGASDGTYTGTGTIPGGTTTSRSTVEPVTAAPSTGLTTGDTTTLPTRGKYDTESATGQPSVPVSREEEKDNTARNTAIGAGAGAAAVGAGAYGAHEYSKHEAEKAEAEAAKEQARREKDLAREQAAREKDLEDRRKAEEKAAAKEEKQHQKELEKEEKHHQKELEKEEKHRQKELEKEEKHRQKDLEKEEKEREKEREREAEVLALKERREREREEALIKKQKEEAEEERKVREERERLAAGVGIGGAAGAGAATATREQDEEKPKEKKPNIFKRIFKRRKNKDTGVEEEYSSDEEQHPTADPQVAHSYGDKVVGIGHGGTYEEQSGGAQKPSYNPFSKDEAAVTSGAAAGTTAYAVGHEKQTAPATVESTGTHTQQPSETVTGVPASTTTHTRETAPSTLPETSTESHQPATAVTGTTATGIQHDPITGLAYDPSKDPEAARRISEHTHGMGEGAESTGNSSLIPDFKMGEIGDTRR